MSLRKEYRAKLLPALKEDLKLGNINAVPRLEKVVVNVGIGSYILKKDKDYSVIESHLSAITGQKPQLVEASKAVSNFKLRKGMPNGLKVTLRGNEMLNFLDRLINTVLPRIRDFRGVSKRSFDGQGNYSLGIKEVTVFPEVKINDLNRVYGLQINISTSATEDDQARSLLAKIGLPFNK